MWLVAGVALLGVFVSGATGWLLSINQKHLLEKQFAADAELRISAIQDRLWRCLKIGEVASGLFAASERVTRDEFEAFCRAFTDYFPRVEAILWFPRVKAPERSAHERAAQAELQQAYEICQFDHQGRLIPVDQRAEYFPAAYSFTSLGSASESAQPMISLGWDLASSPAGQQAIESATVSGNLWAVRGVDLMNRPVDDRVLVLAPVFPRGEAPRSSGARRLRLMGLVGVVVGIEELLEHSVRPLPPVPVDLHLFYSSPGQPEHLLATCPSAMRIGRFIPQPNSAAATAGTMHLARRLSWPGMPWTIVCTPTDVYELREFTFPPWVVMAGGISLTFLISAYLASLLGRATRVERLVAERAADLQRAKESLEEEIAQREKIEEILRNSQALYSSLVENLPVHVLRKDLEGRFTFANQSFCRLVGLRLEEIVGKTDFDLYPADLARKYREDDRRVAEIGELFECEEENEQDGERRYVHVMKSPVRDASGKVVGTQVVFWDVTEQRRAQAALEHERYLLHALMDHLPHAIYFKDAESRFLRINRALAKSFGLKDASEACGRTDFDFFAEEHARLAREDELQVMRTGQPIIDKEEKETWPDGRVTWVSTTKLPLYDEQGRIVGTFGISRDITEQKAAAEALRAAKEAAEAASLAKSTFLANMSHEIRTPMNVIINMTELLLEGPLTGAQREYLMAVIEAGETLLALINDILDFSKVEAGRLELEQESFDLHETVQDTVRWLAVRAHQKGLELVCRIRSDVPVGVVGDSTRLRQVIVNLIGNAIKFTDHGEVVLSVEPEQFLDGEVILRFTVRDTGIGIPPEKLSDIFEAFEQADTSRTRRHTGTGLGLAISRKLAELMGGQIWVKSQLGQGSEFHFTVRLGLTPLEKPPHYVSQPSFLAGLRVLVVDDNASNRRILEEILSNWGMCPVLAASADEALAILKKAQQAGEAIPLVLTDVHMPGRDGFNLAEVIKNQMAIGSTIIMMLTSGERPEDVQRCEQLGVSAFLLKPVKQSELFDAIILALGGTSTGRSILEEASEHIKRRKPARPLRILLAEDSPLNQKVARGMLRTLGHEVIVVGNGREAISAFQRGGIDLVIMDVQMPEVDGFEATQTIREIEKRKGGHIPILAMTAHAMKGDRERCLAAGMDEYLPKPIQIDALFEKLETLAQQYPVQHPPSAIDSNLEVAPSAPSSPDQTAASGIEPSFEISTETAETIEGVSGSTAKPFPTIEGMVQKGMSDSFPPQKAAWEDDGSEAGPRGIVPAEVAVSANPAPATSPAANSVFPAASAQECPPAEGVSTAVARDSAAKPSAGVAAETSEPTPVTSESKPMSGPAPMEPSSKNWPDFSLEEALRTVRGDPELLWVICESVVEDTPRLLKEIRRAIQEQDAKNLRLYAHTLKGAIRYFGPTRAFEQCFELEKMGREGRFEGVDPLFEEVAGEVQRLQQILLGYMEAHPRNRGTAE